MADYVRGGPPPYSLAEACQDRYLDILAPSCVIFTTPPNDPVGAPLVGALAVA